MKKYIFFAFIELMCSLAFAETIRPMEILVVDALTKQPITNTLVYYVVISGRWRHIFGLPIPDPVEYYDLVQEKYYTDENGCVRIAPRNIKLRLYEEVCDEYIYVNLDVARTTLDKSERNTDAFFNAHVNDPLVNPNDKFYGAIIRSTKEELKPDWYTGVVTNGTEYKCVLIQKGLTKKSDKVVVSLDRVQRCHLGLDIRQGYYRNLRCWIVISAQRYPHSRNFARQSRGRLCLR